MPHATPGPARDSEIISAFARLAKLLDGLEPGLPVIDISVGGPRHPLPSFLMEKLEEAQADFGRYPGITGSDDFRAAIAQWLEGRYPAVRGVIDPQANILALCGSREGLFSAVFPAIERRGDLHTPAALIPNPFYQTYAAGAMTAGAEPIYLKADAESGFLPKLEAIDAELLARTAVFFLCSPSNPQGAVASKSMLKRAIELARQHNFMLFADECYSEIYTGEKPPGVLEVAAEMSGEFANILAFHSLSKRSNLPGLRAGFCAGDPEFLAKLAKFRNVIAPQLPLPIQHAAAAIWRDEKHVEENRQLYREKFDMADEVLGGKFGYSRPKGGFFLWLNVAACGGGEEAVKTLWKDCGVKLLPGAYLSRTHADGSNPGADYVRVAMVAPYDEMKDALTRIVERLGKG